MPDAALADRLAVLERAHRRLQRLVAALVLCLAATALIAAGSGGDGVLAGRSLQLLDAEGKVRILANAASGLSFLDAAGRPRAILGLDHDGHAGLVLYGDGSRAILNVNGDGPALAFTGPRGVLRAILALVKGDPGLVFFDSDERERAALGLRAGAGTATLRDSDGGFVWQVPK